MGMMKTKDEKVFAGAIFGVHRETWTDEKGVSCVREVVRKPPAVAILAYDDEAFWVVYQPREATGEVSFMELPAGRLTAWDGPLHVETLAQLEMAKRELAEEVGLTAEVWDRIAGFYSSPGFSDEWVTVFAATVLEPCERPPADDATVPIRVPLEDLDEYLAACDDAKTIIALNWLRERLAQGVPADGLLPVPER